MVKFSLANFRLSRTRVFWWMLQALAFVIPVSQWLSIKILLLVLILSVYSIVIEKKYSTVFRQGWDAGLYLFVLIAGLIYTSDMTTGLKVIESSLSLIAVPVIFSSGKAFSKKNYEILFVAFTAGVIVASLICLTHAIWAFNETGSAAVFFYYQLTSVVNVQPTYMSYYLIFALTFIVYSLYYDRIKINLLLVLAAIALLYTMLSLTGGLTSLISLIFIFAFFILKFLQEHKTRTKAVTIALVVIMTIGMFSVFSRTSDGDTNDYWERSVLWESALKASPDFFQGVGTGDFRNVLNQYFKDHNLTAYADSSLNSHNEFTEILFSNGVPGLIALLLLIGRPLFLSVSRRNILGVLTFFPFIIYGVTEVFLGRYQGVIFFMFLHQAFIASFQTPHTAISFKNT